MTLPEVTELEAGGDRAWFLDNPRRRYRLRRGEAGWWIVRRRGRSTMLRVFTQTVPRGVPDNDEALRGEWFRAAWATLDRDELLELIDDAARKLEKPPGGPARRNKAGSRRRKPRPRTGVGGHKDFTHSGGDT